MATQKPISTISYNTEDFLREKLDNWYKAHIIQAYQYIKHIGEDGDKDHIHLRIEPNKKLDPMDLLEGLKQYVAGNDKPLTCRPFRPSKEEDWFLYVVHDPDFLKLKGESGKLRYKWEDIKASLDYDVQTAFIRARQSLQHLSPSIVRALEGGTSAKQLINEGENPFLVKSCLQLLQTCDYESIALELKIAREQNSKLLSALSKVGLTFAEDNDGTLFLVNLSTGEKFIGL